MSQEGHNVVWIGALRSGSIALYRVVPRRPIMPVGAVASECGIEPI